MDTRERLLIAAERLFAERGVDGISLREVGERAGQRNNSAVQYHFGGKRGLIQALYDLRLVPLNEARTRMLEQMGEPTVPELVRAYVTPLSDAVIASGGTWAYARFLDRYLMRGRDAEPFDDHHSSASTEVVRLMRARVRDMDPAIFEERRRMMAVMVIRTLADLEYRLEYTDVDDAAAKLTVEVLIEAISVMMVAPTALTAPDGAQ